MTCDEKVSDVKTQIKHSNICDVALKRIKKYCGKKTKNITEEEKQKYKAFSDAETGTFIIEKLTRDIIEHCKLPEAMELRKRLGYNHDDIIFWEETSIAEKIIKLFRNENIVLNKKFNNQIFGLKIIRLLLRLMKEIMKNRWWKRKRRMFKKHDFKIFWFNTNDPNFDRFKFLGEINLDISKLREGNAENKGNNKAINKVAEDFEKIVGVTKSKELNQYGKDILPNYKKWKTHNQN